MPPQDACSAKSSVQPKARPSIHTAILDWFEAQPRGTVLDAPSGYGHLSLRLAEKGFDVTAGEVDPKIFAVPELPCVHTDLNRQIDAPDGSFDYVVCVDGLEHMTDPYTAVAEFSRVLRPGGIGVFSLPNYTGIERRLKFFFRGYFTSPVEMETYRAGGSVLFNFHNSILTVTILEFMFRIRGLEVVEWRKNRTKRKQQAFLPLVFLMRLVARCLSARRRRAYRTDLTLHPNVILGGNTLIAIVRKEGEPIDSPGEAL